MIINRHIETRTLREYACSRRPDPRGFIVTTNTKVLVTGSAGGVGKAVCAALMQTGHVVHGFDRLQTPDVHEAVIGDIVDRAAVNAACAGMDAIIHLAATPDEADFIDELIEPNVRGLFHICDAAREQRVPRLILTSSVQVVSGHRFGDLG